MVKGVVRRYYLADLYVLDCRKTDDETVSSIEDRLEKLGTYVVSQMYNDGFEERVTGKKLGSIDLAKLDRSSWADGQNYPNIYVDINSVKKVSPSEIKDYLEKDYFTIDSNKLETFFERTVILNGMIPLGKSYYYAPIVTTLDGLDETVSTGADGSKYIVSHGNYIVKKDKEYGYYIELLTGKQLGSIEERLSIRKQHTDPHYYIRRFYSKENPTLFVDKNNTETISETELYGKVEEYCSLYDSREIEDAFAEAAVYNNGPKTHSSLSLSHKNNDEKKNS